MVEKKLNIATEYGLHLHGIFFLEIACLLNVVLSCTSSIHRNE